MSQFQREEHNYEVLLYIFEGLSYYIPSWHGYIIIQSDLYKKLSSTALCLDFEQKKYTNIIFNHRRMWGQRFFWFFATWWSQPTQVTSATSGPRWTTKKNNNCQLECLPFFCNQRAKTKLQGLNHLRKSRWWNCWKIAIIYITPIEIKMIVSMGTHHKLWSPSKCHAATSFPE